jgi:hypothetical protein
MNVQPRSSFGTRSTIGCGRCPFMQGVEAGVPFPVGLSSLRLLTKCALSQAWRLGGLHRASPVPFRGSCFTSGLHLPDATPQGLIACLYKRRGFPPITSLRLVAHSCPATSVVRAPRWPSLLFAPRGRQSGGAVDPARTRASLCAAAPGTTRYGTASVGPCASGTRSPQVSSGAC